MQCDKCDAIGAGFEEAQPHRRCSGKWRGITNHPTPTRSWADRHQEALLSPHWKHLRGEALKAQGGRCKRCDATEGLQLHHIHYDTLGAETLADVELLCDKHHRIADLEREETNAFYTWHSKKYGQATEIHEYQIEEFNRWLERKQETFW